MTEIPKKKTLTREELYALVWSTPMNRLARDFGLSDQGLAKICQRHDVPRPAQGHWNKLAAGKPVVIRELPALGKGIDPVIVLTATPSAPQLDASTEAQLAAARARTSKIRVSERLANPHPVIAGWIDRRDREVKKREDVYDFRLRKLGKAAPFTLMERRRNRVLDAILKGLAGAGLTIKETERRELVAAQGPDSLEIQLRVKLQQVRRPLTADEQRWRLGSDKDYKIEMAETDVLIFEIKTWLPSGLQRVWQDNRKGQLEDFVGDIVATLIAAFPLMVVARERREEQARLHRIEEQRRYDEERRRKLERDRFRRYLEHARRWKEAELAREFMEALRASDLPDDVTVDDRDADQWMAWVEERIRAHCRIDDDPFAIFESIAAVTSYTYRD